MVLAVGFLLVAVVWIQERPMYGAQLIGPRIGHLRDNHALRRVPGF
jgi:hypothetical protein